MDELGLRPFIVRRYTSADRTAVREVCCQTGFLGQPIDPVFEDRDLFADFFTDYYLRCEPDAAFVDRRPADGRAGATGISHCALPDHRAARAVDQTPAQPSGHPQIDGAGPMTTEKRR